MMVIRRVFLKGTLSSAAIALAASCSLLFPMQVLGSWKQDAFMAKNLQTAIKSLLGSDLSIATDQITINAPEVAENGAIVPITVSSTLKNVRRMSLFAENNSTPLVAFYDLDRDTQAFISTRIKLNETSKVIAITTVGDKHYSARKVINVTISGCSN